MENLETRQLLTFIPFTPERGVAGSNGGAPVFAVADNHSFLFASVTTQHTLLVTRYSSTGAPIGNPLTVAQDAGPFSVAADADGDAVVAYVSGSTVYFRQISKQGQIGIPVKVNSLGHNITFAQASMDSSGGFFVGWIDDLGGGGGLLQMRAYTAAGAARGPQFTAAGDSFETDDLVEMSLSANPDGSGAVFAGSVDVEAPGDLVFFGRVNATSRVGGFHFISKSVATPRIAANKDGSFVLAYDGGPFFVDAPFTFVQMFGADDKPLIQPISLGKLLGNEDISTGHATLATLADGGFVASFYTTNQNGYVSYAARFHADGSIETPPLNLNHGDIPVIDAAADGTSVVSWYGPDTTRYRRLTADFAAIDRSELYVLGGPSNNVISVAQSQGKVIVTSGTKVREFDAQGINALTINAADGRDSIQSSVSIPTTIQGGIGDDDIGVPRGTAPVLVSGQDDIDSVNIGDGVGATVYGGNGNDFLRGGAGSQYLDGQGDQDLVQGGEGDDRLFGGTEDDRLEGGAGNDTLDGGAGRDMIVGSDGNDVMLAADNEHDRLFGGRGNDSAKRDKKLDAVDGIETLT